MALAACSTVSTRRADPPVLNRVTSHNLAEFQECFAAAVADVTPPPNYLPRSGGGSYTYTLNSYVVWVVDITAEGVGNRVTVYTPNAGGDIRRRVEACV